MLPSSVHCSQRLGQRSQPLLYLFCLSIRFSQQGEMIRPEQLCPCGPSGGQALVYLFDALLCLPLHGQCPAMRYDAPCGTSRKLLLVREHAQCFGLLLHCPCLVQELMEHGIPGPDNSRAKRVSNLLSQGQRCATPRQRLVRIPKQPQDISQKGEIDYSEIRSNTSNGRAPLPRVVKGKGLLTVGAR